MRVNNIMLVLFVLAMLISGGIASSNGKGVQQDAQPVLSADAIKGPTVTDLTIHMPPNVTTVKKIQVKAYYVNNTLKFTRNFFDMAVLNGIIQIQLDNLDRGEKVDVSVLTGKDKNAKDKKSDDEETENSETLKASTVVRLRPDLAFYSVIIAEKVLVGGTLSINVTVQEINGDMGAGAIVSLMDGGTVLDAKNVNVSAGSMTSLILSTAINSGGQYNLSVKITNAVPAEYNETNNIYSPLVVSAVSPDLGVASVNAPAQVVVGEMFEALATISELSGNTGANAVVALLENGTVLDSRNIAVPAGGSGIVSLSTVFGTGGEHTLNVRISNAVPAENNEANNIYPLVVRVLSPDLTVTSVSAPVNATVGEMFEALATISELSGNTGANAVVALLENGTVLDSRNIAVPAGGSGVVSLSTVFRTRGEHTLSVRITSTVPADYNETNNIYPLVVNAVSPDLAVTNVNAPATVAIGQGFELLATISELYGEIGANATVALVDNSIVLDSKILSVPAGGSDIVSLNGSLDAAGSHNITVRIIDSAPPDAFPGNNEQTIIIRAVKPPEPMAFSSNYYYQNTSLYRSRYITGSDYGEKGEEQEFREDEVISFTAVSNRSLTFPLRVNISIINETGEGNIFKETGVIPTSVEGSRRIFTKHYNESETTLTIGVDETGISMNIEGKANSTIKHSIGYKQWIYGFGENWDVTTNSSSGKLIRARETLQVRIELEDSSHFLGGNALTIPGNESYTGGWVDTTDGRVEEQRIVWVYSGSSSGDTVI